jgi:membrane protease YdiL (CAAX protease family)
MTGFVAISLLIAMMWLSGALTFDGLKLHGTLALEYGLRWLLSLLLVGIAEECMNRAYILIALARAFGLVTAVMLTSITFAMAHAGNPGENLAGLLQVFLFGSVCALSVFRTGSVWWAVAFHGAWNWAQEYFYGTLGSGYWYDGHLFQLRAHGRPLLSGSTVGPEGSIYVFVVLGCLLAYEVHSLRGTQIRGARTSPERAWRW